ncbi:hypothetical protein FEE95_01840 [Maribacter algarum]|uniref:Uncharacterized protein n=1 Tax=Maribacter algarum (ex Zhang et al. 2020) TaxID=2578118 RepID=A0A5S3PVH2_9FLAO|nr:hypothetical protein [Maribacter algarum]TMM58192.1 hypothetical protein FEE95_01840 [Maribacter algarum]
MKKTDSEMSHLKKAIPSDGTRFGFVNRLQTGVGELFQKVNTLLYQVADSKPYHLDYKEVEEKYYELGFGDIDEFASSYALGWAMMNDFVNDNVIKQAVYEEVRIHLWQKREQGEIE